MDFAPIEEFIVIEKKGEGLCVGLGPFEESEKIIPGSYNFYAPDYFLLEENKYLIPRSTVWLQGSRGIQGLDGDASKALLSQITWEKVSYEEYSQLFSKIHSLLIRGELTKAVPVIFEHGRVEQLHIDSLVEPLFSLPSTIHGYALRRGKYFVVGASPEILFSFDTSKNLLFSEAVAGTVHTDESRRLFSEGIFLEEHESVVSDIASILGGFGEVETGKAHVQNIRDIAHRRTKLSVKIKSIDIPSLIHKLHPTGALGVIPRSRNRESLRSLSLEERGRFGAPFGFIAPDGCAHFVVAIRNIEITDTRARIGSGSGILEDSALEVEWSELMRKRDTVKALFRV